MVLNSMKQLTGIRKLKALLKKYRLSKNNFIETLKFKGTARIPDELKVTSYSLSY
jgi:hypothetical protein